MRDTVQLYLVSLLLLLAVFPAFAQTRAEETGRELHEELLETERFYADEALNQYVNRIGQQLVEASGFTDFDFKFFIIDDETVNAFALPGGYIYIHRGLMTFMTNEAQLAAVLAHEIAHVTQEHHRRQQTASTLGNVAAFAASVATWNSDVGEAISMWNAARISGYGRDMELEADERGAVYMYRSGYDPQAVIEMLSILKDHETLMRSEARAAGGSGSVYHGVFSTHPRSDQRLREVVSQAGMLPPGEAFTGRDQYREMMEGVTFGPSLDSNAPPGLERYVHKGLAVTFLYPTDWRRTTSGSNIQVAAVDSEAALRLSVNNLTEPDSTAEEIMIAGLGVDRLFEVKKLYSNVDEDIAATGILRSQAGERRVAGIKLGSYFYQFEVLGPANPDKDLDETFLGVMQSFRRASENDLPPERELSLFYRRLEPGETFAELAANSVLGARGEGMLRLINGYYPDGEAPPGTWIKLVE